jgi:ParB family chromosome partitioning protein
MKVVDIRIDGLLAATWNPNKMNDGMLTRLRESILRFGIVENMVVRKVADGCYEVLSGNHRLQVLRELGIVQAPCVVIEADDAKARLVAQALNNIEGKDDLGLKADLINEVLRSVPQSEVFSLLPESAASLRDLSNLGRTNLVESLQAWERARNARLRHLTFQLSNDQLEVVEKALARTMPGTAGGQENPNRRGNALYRLSLEYLNNVGGKTLE